MKPLKEVEDRPLRSSQQDVRLSYKRILPRLPGMKLIAGKTHPKSHFSKTPPMEKPEENRSRRLVVRFKPTEFELIEKRFKKTLFRKLSEYTRNVLLEKSITVTYRDKAMDEVLEELILLRRELNAIGNNLNQAVYQINAAHGNADMRLWANLLATVNGKVEPAILQIKERMNHYADIWSQKLKAEKA